MSQFINKAMNLRALGAAGQFDGCGARAPLQYVATEAGLDKPVYGCDKGPFQSRSWEGYDADVTYGNSMMQAVASPCAAAKPAAAVARYVRTEAGIDSPVYGDVKGPFQSRSWEGYDAGAQMQMQMAANAAKASMCDNSMNYAVAANATKAMCDNSMNYAMAAQNAYVSKPLAALPVTAMQSGCGQVVNQGASMRAAINSVAQDSAIFTPSQYYYAGGPMASPFYNMASADLMVPRVNSYAALY